MKKIMKLGIITSFAALAIAAANAQTTNTNVVLTLNFALTGFTQSGDDAKAVRISNKDIISVLSSNGVNVGKSAKLVLVDDQSGNFSFQVRQGTGANATITPIDPGTLNVTLSPIVVTAKNGTDYTILEFAFSDGAGDDFDVSGFATVKHGRLSGRGIGNLNGVRVGAAVQVSGTGHINGNTAVLRGTISAGGPKAEAD